MIPSVYCAMALAVWPQTVIGWRFTFHHEREDVHPDARAEALALDMNTLNLRAGFFKLPMDPDIGGRSTNVGEGAITGGGPLT